MSSWQYLQTRVEIELVLIHEGWGFPCIRRVSSPITDLLADVMPSNSPRTKLYKRIVCQHHKGKIDVPSTQLGWTSSYTKSDLPRLCKQYEPGRPQPPSVARGAMDVPALCVIAFCEKFTSQVAGGVVNGSMHLHHQPSQFLFTLTPEDRNAK
ncbi:uncharacterized protein BKA55DRAFT_675529 [Fusarium redolens]|uniref:Uncharacterized protein n=1 Tax=Fusarium redolens TaxID=48865 RepID=A0A9P9KA15_FUSRE|nr:uncharacterized protein BKA55DRAFT_675529 [Fusarium redolens]KAH7249641.1 hypothetical protein BKA55DRAFT_675529 [Fusarium redolens]